jgi:hypothetical protein
MTNILRAANRSFPAFCRPTCKPNCATQSAAAHRAVYFEYVYSTAEVFPAKISWTDVLFLLKWGRR